MHACVLVVLIISNIIEETNLLMQQGFIVYAFIPLRDITSDVKRFLFVTTNITCYKTQFWSSHPSSACDRHSKSSRACDVIVWVATNQEPEVNVER